MYWIIPLLRRYPVQNSGSSVRDATIARQIPAIALFQCFDAPMFDVPSRARWELRRVVGMRPTRVSWTWQERIRSWSAEIIKAAPRASCADLQRAQVSLATRHPPPSQQKSDAPRCRRFMNIGMRQLRRSPCPTDSRTYWVQLSNSFLFFNINYIFPCPALHSLWHLSACWGTNVFRVSRVCWTLCQYWPRLNRVLAWQTCDLVIMFTPHYGVENVTNEIKASLQPSVET